MTSRQFDGVNSVSIFNNQLATIVLFGIAEEESCGKIGAYAMRRAGYLSNRVINVITKRLSSLITIEEWRKDFQRQRRGHKYRIPLEGRENRISKLFCVLMIFGQLQVVLSS